MRADQRVCFFGDSFVNGTGDDEALGWVGRLCAAERRAGADLTVYNLGVRRDTSADVLGRWRAEAGLRLPAAVLGRLVFSFGLNDLARDEAGASRIAPARTLANAAEILGEASALWPTLMVGPPPITDDAGRNAEIVRLSADLGRLCADAGVPFLDLTAFAVEHLALWRAEAEAGDGIHPNAKSYAALAGVVGRWSAWRAWFD